MILDLGSMWSNSHNIEFASKLCLTVILNLKLLLNEPYYTMILELKNRVSFFFF